jgi:hypothetical protein
MVVAAGRPARELMERIGHSSPAAALRYQHVMKDRDKAIAAGLDRLAQAADILTAMITTTTPPTVVARNSTTAAQAHRPGEAGPLSCGNWVGTAGFEPATPCSQSIWAYALCRAAKTQVTGERNPSS